MTADDTTTASKAEEYVLLGDPEKTTALPDLPKTTEPADKTIVAETTTHAATYEAALKEAAPDAPPSVGDAAAALKDATLRELGAAREKASTSIQAAARARRWEAARRAPLQALTLVPGPPRATRRTILRPSSRESTRVPHRITLHSSSQGSMQTLRQTIHHQWRASMWAPHRTNHRSSSP